MQSSYRYNKPEITDTSTSRLVTYAQGHNQMSPDGRAHFLKHTTPIVSYIASYWHAGSYMHLFMGVLKV